MRIPSSPGRLEKLHIYQDIPQRLKATDFRDSGERITLALDSPVFTRQVKLWAATVEEYRSKIATETFEPIDVTDIVPGGGVWHLNGLHRLVAARLAGLPVEARVWR